MLYLYLTSTPIPKVKGR